MIYTHPYARGFSVWVKREGYLSVGVLFWKWEFVYNSHQVGAGIDTARKVWERKITAAEAETATYRQTLNDLSDRRLFVTKYRNYPTNEKTHP